MYLKRLVVLAVLHDELDDILQAHVLPVLYLIHEELLRPWRIVLPYSTLEPLISGDPSLLVFMPSEQGMDRRVIHLGIRQSVGVGLEGIPHRLSFVDEKFLSGLDVEVNGDAFGKVEFAAPHVVPPMTGEGVMGCHVLENR